MQIAKFGKLTLLVGLMSVMALVLAACGGDEEEKSTIVFSDLDWNSAQIQNWIARTIIEEGYGHPTDSVFGGTIPLMEALAAGDTDVTMEIWLPNQQAAWDEAFGSGEVQILGNSLEDNWQSSYIIPQYTADANPNLKSVSDLPDHKDLFTTAATGDKGRLLHCIPGWECEVINEKKLTAYGLEDTFELVNPGSLAALDAEIISAFENQEDILFYYWGPTTLSHTLSTQYGGYVVLEEPAYTDECEASDWGCAYPLAEVLVATRVELNDEAPDVVEFLKKWDFSAGNQLAAEGYMGESGEDFPEVAKWFLENTDDWKNWVPADVAEAVLEGIAG